MSPTNDASVNFTAIGWLLGLTAPVLGVFAIGFPLQPRLEAMGAPGFLVAGAPVFGALVGVLVLLVAFRLIARYRGPDRESIARHFDDDS